MRKEVKAGLLVVAAIGLFVFGYNFIKGRDIFQPQRKFYAVYEKVDGLVTSNPVIINGFGIGQVLTSEIIPGKEGRILVSFSVNNDHLQIPENSIAKIVSMDLLGSKAIEILLGDAVVYLDRGDTLTSEVEVSLSEEVNRQVAPLKNKAEHLLSSVDSVLTIVQAVLNKQTIADLEKSFQSLSRTMSSLERTAFRLDTVIGEEKSRINTIMRNLESITNNLKDNNEHIANVISNFSNISDSIAKSNLTSTINNAEKTLSQTSEIFEKINRGEGSLGMLIHNDSLYKNLEKASLDMDKLLIDMKANPQRYLHFSIIGRRDKGKKKN